MIRRATLTVALLALLISVPTGAAVAADPSLAIAISDGVDEVGPGDTLEYTVTISNRAGETFVGVVTMTPPAYVTLSESSVAGDAATWDVTIPAGETEEIRATASVGDEPGDNYQVVVTASVAAADAPLEVLVRAADADRIPGAVAPPPVTGMTEADPVPPGIWALVVAGVLVALGAVGGLVAWFRHRRNSAGPPSHGRRKMVGARPQ